MKLLAKELEVPVIADRHRSVETRQNWIRRRTGE